MPILLRCDELKPGMRLCEPVVAHGRTLLTGGKVLSPADVDVLSRRFPDVWARLGDPILDPVVEFEDDSHDRTVAATVKRRIVQVLSEVTERFSSRASIRATDVGSLRDPVTEVMEYLAANPVSSALPYRDFDSSSPLHEHAGNVFYLSMILGTAARDYIYAERRRMTACRGLDLKFSMDLLPLGLGAMLCDLAMFPLQHLYDSREPLSQEDRRAIREHPAVGVDMLPEGISPVVRAIVRTHHENFDGTGYPGALERDRVHIFSRIVRIADAFAAATASRLYKEAKSPARALWEMSVGPYSRFYDPVLMKVFGRLIQPYPIGAKLRLNDGRYAVAVRYDRQNPFKPTVIIAFDAHGKHLQEGELVGPVDLIDDPDLRIASFGEEQLSYLYNPIAPDAEPAASSDVTSLFDSVYP